MRLNSILLALVAALAAFPVAAQLSVPPVGGVLQDPLGRVGEIADPLAAATRDAMERAGELARQRTDRILQLVRRNPETIELDAQGEPARRGELVLLEADDASLAALTAAGFGVIGEERLEALGLVAKRLKVPEAMSLADAQTLVARLAPTAQASADSLYFRAGDGEAAGNKVRAKGAPAAPPIETRVGMIDGAPAPGSGAAYVRGFARGAPRAEDHASEVSSLLAGAGVRRLLAADVYGEDPAGGNALAIAAALDWLVEARAQVIVMSLVGPENPVLTRAISAARGRGITLVAAVGNDGPAAPPAYPASYPGVLAITGVDGRNRALIEAGRAAHLDYAAPGADIRARNAAGRMVKVRGTSFAAPLAAARAAAAIDAGKPLRETLDAEARDLGPKGADSTYGRGLLCGACRGR